jgi:hypothetical protein
MKCMLLQESEWLLVVLLEVFSRALALEWLIRVKVSLYFVYLKEESPLCDNYRTLSR